MTSTPIAFQRSVRRVRGESLIGLDVGTVFGVGVRVDGSLVIVFGLILYNLGARVFPAWHPDWTPASNWTLAVIAALSFLAAVVFHELGHALAARRFGAGTRSVTLFLFGGLADIKEHPPTPGAEFLIASSGPAASLALGVMATWGAGVLLGSSLAVGEAAALQEQLRAAGPVATLLLWFGSLNLLLALFNLLPAIPLDGGRLFRAAAWAATDDFGRATRWAAAGGRVIGWSLVAIGVMRLFAGAWVEGAWLVMTGWFLNNAAQISFLDEVLRQLLRDVPIAHVMKPTQASVPPSLPVDEFVRDHLFVGDQSVFPVRIDHRFEGLVSAHEVRTVAPARWARVTVGQIMVPRDMLGVLDAARTAEDAYDTMQRLDREELAVVEGDVLLGFVERADLLKWLTLYERFPRRRAVIPRYRAAAPAH